MTDAVHIWHHGLVARWWAEFNQGGDDIEYFRGEIQASGEPVLDAGCGAGRLLLPYLRTGIDVDGSDASADMLAWCKRTADAEGLRVNLYQQAMHQLDLPRRYRTIIVCGAFGLGAARNDDLEGLRRIHAHLQPGGRLIMDHYLPNLESPRSWSYWIEQPELPRPWPDHGDRRRAGDGTDMELRTRLLAIDPLQQTTILEIRAALWVDGNEAVVETRTIGIALYFKNEIELMLTMAGFHDIETTGFPGHEPPQAWQDKRIVFHAVA